MALISLIYWLALPPQIEQHLIPNADVARVIAELRAHLNAAIDASARAPGGVTVSSDLLDRLDAALQTDNRAKAIRVTGKTEVLAAKPNAFESGRPVLPEEDVRDGRWFFKPIRFELKPRYLFVSAITFKATRTIRLRRVTFLFRDGTKSVHRQWEGEQDGNGRDFPKRIPLPWLPIYPDGGEGPAKRLAAVEILGSAQDGDFDAKLDFLFKIPDQSADNPLQKALDQAAALRKRVEGVPLQPERARQALRDLNRLAETLEQAGLRL